ncbi:hypothetical protein [Methylobacterium sp. Leaf112]|uniref:hypothetical protein n=1 Tax=Methylobacterium sp. Leaf112 TaxID=1736258 RepID=UPI000B12527D|nr:hypothetical protein [Methylobacterium sp. Leaf112]
MPPSASNTKPPRAKPSAVSSPRRATLDSQLLTYWEREAVRLDALAASTRWRWIARGYARKAERARAQAARSADREAARGRIPEAMRDGDEPAT